MSSRLAAQMYTVRDFTKTPQGIAESLRKIREIGYEAVQVSAIGPIDYKELKKMLDGEGLVACAQHSRWESFLENIEAVIEEYKTIDCRHAAIGSIPGKYRSAEGFKQFAEEGSRVAERLAQEGMTFSYHNHSFEFERFGDRTGMQILIEESDPKLCFEIDTYWVQHGGGDPAAWIRKVKGRAPLVHLKDMVVQGKEVVMAEVGEGNMNWESILAACREAGVEWYMVEQDICQRDPFESLAISYRNLKAMGL